MITPDQAYAAFRDANPAPVVDVEALPSPVEALRMAQQAPTPTAPHEPPRRSVRVGVLTAAAAFVLVIVIGVLAYLAGRGDGENEFVDDPVVTTTLLPQTTTVPPTTTVPDTTVAEPTITPETQALLDEFAASYGRDFDTFVGLLDPGLQIEIRFQDPPAIWDLEDLREQFAFYEVLNTDLELSDCRALDGDAISCTMLRRDDLVRIQGLEAATDGLLTVRFRDGLVTSWAERYNLEIAYQDLVVRPFANWLRDTYPELPNPKVLGGAPWWTPQGDIVEQLPALVAEYAASLGVTLDG